MKRVVCVAIFLGTVFLFSLEHAQARLFTGIVIGETATEYAKFMGLAPGEGVYVQTVLKGSPAEKAGLRSGDVILEAQGGKIGSAAAFREIVKHAGGEEPLVLLIARGRERRTVSIPPAEAAALSPPAGAKPAAPAAVVSGAAEIDADSFETEVLRSSSPALVYFTAPWCAPCRAFLPHLSRIVKDYGGDARVYQLDIQKNRDLAAAHGISAIPSLALFSEGKEFEKIIRVSSHDQVEGLLRRFLDLREDHVELFAKLGREASVRNAVFVERSDWILTQSADGAMRLWDYKNGRLIRAYPAGLTAAAGSGRHIVAASGERTSLELTDVESRETRRIAATHFVKALAVSPDGRYVASFGMEQDARHTLNIWDAASGKRAVSIASSADHANLAFSPDSRHLAAAMGGRTVLLAAGTGSAVASFPHPDESFTQFRFTRDGRFIHARGKKARLFDIRENAAVPLDLSVIGLTPDAAMLFMAHLDNSFSMSGRAGNDRSSVFRGHIGPAAFATASGDGRLVLSGSFDGTARLWDSGSGRELGQFVGFSNGEWIVATPEGYYNASPRGHQHLNVRRGQKAYSIEQFYDVFYRPDIVAAKIGGEDLSGVAPVTIDEAVRNPPPHVEIVTLPETVETPATKVCYRIRNAGGGIGEVRVFQNGKLVHSDGYYRDLAKTPSARQIASLTGKAIYEGLRGISVAAKGGGAPQSGRMRSLPRGETVEECRELDAVAGDNEVAVAAFNGQNTVQSFMQTRTFRARVQEEKPRLFVLSIGIDAYGDPGLNLKYAARDAADFAKMIKTQASTVYDLRQMRLDMLLDRQATKAQILRAFDDLSRSIRPADGFILFVAGHGVLLEEQYYMLTHDFDGKVSESSMISSNELVEFSKRLKSLNQLLIFDTCHAGGIDYIVSGLYDARMSNLARKMGLHVYASASSREKALDGYQGNGLFTHALLDGLNNKRNADKDGSGKVSVVELGAYAQETTAGLSAAAGHQQTPVIINFGGDRDLYRLRDQGLR